MRIQLLILSIFVCIMHVNAQSPKFEDGWWMPNGAVKTIALDTAHKKVYIGGSFDMVGPRNPYNLLISHGSGKLRKSAAKANDTVYTCIADGNGGWFLGGQFTKVGDSARNGVAQIDSLGRVTAFGSGKKGVIGKVYALHILGKYLFIGGKFKSVNGAVRYNLASLLLSDASVTPWSPVADEMVLSFNSKNKYLYVGGRFSMIDSSNCFRLAAIDTGTGKPTKWNPGVNGDVNTIAIYDTFIFVGGKFTAAAFKTAQNLAIFSTNNPILLNKINFYPPGSITNIRIINNQLHICGNIGSYYLYDTKTSNSYAQPVATFSLPGLTPVVWKTFKYSYSNIITDIAKYKQTYYLCGSFTDFEYPAIYRSRFMAIDSATQKITALECNISNTVYKIGASASGIYAVGEFISAEGVTRSNLARYSINGFSPDNWNPRTDRIVNKILIENNLIFIGGNFVNIAGVQRNRIACINYNTNLVTGFNPDADGEVNALGISKNKLIIGGVFYSVASQKRQNIAITDTTLGYCFVQNPYLNGKINDLKIHDNKLLIAGEFNYANAQYRNRIARLDTTNFLADTIGTDYQSDAVNCILPLKGSIFMGISANLPEKSECLLKIDSATGKITTWNSLLNKNVNDLIYFSNTLIAGGSFTKSGTLNRKGIASFRLSPYAVLPFNPQPDMAVNTLGSYGKRLFIGGAFNKTSNEWQRGFAVYYDTCVAQYDTIKAVACNQYIWRNNTYTLSGIYSSATYNNAGCPTIHILKLDVLKPTVGKLHTISACKKLVYNNKTYTTSGTYIVTLKNHMGCDSLDSLQVNILNINRYVSKQNDTLRASENSASYQWYSCDSNYQIISGETNQHFKPLKGGYYAVAVTKNGCTDTSECYLFWPAGYTQNRHSGFGIYPNPANEILYVQNIQNHRIYSIVIHDISGRKAIEQIENSNQINVRNLKPGIYFLSIYTENGIVNFRFQKN